MGDLVEVGSLVSLSWPSWRRNKRRYRLTFLGDSGVNLFVEVMVIDPQMHLYREGHWIKDSDKGRLLAV